MDKLIVIAEQEELKLLNHLQILGIEGIPVLITGVGALNVMNALKDIDRNTQIINIGYAGSKNLKRGMYQVNHSTLYHPNVDYNEPRYDCMWFTDKYKVVDCYTGCDFVLQSDKNDCLFDMELAYIHAMGFKYVQAFKYVSDNLDLKEYREVINE